MQEQTGNYSSGVAERQHKPPEGQRMRISPDIVAGSPHWARALSVWATLVLFWLLLSGLYTPFLIAAGVAAALAVTALAVRMRLVDTEGHPIQLCLVALFWYWPWLAKEIIKSAWQVALTILHPALPIAPRIVRFKPSQKSDVALVIHANSITLTPGTVCIEANRDQFIVHALTADSGDGVGPGSAIDRRVSRLEGRT